MASNKDPNADAPATRLLSFVQKAKALQLANAGQQPQVWGTLLGCAATDIPAILRGITEIYALIDLCRKDVHTLAEVDTAPHLATLEEVERAFQNVSLTGAWTDFCGRWTDATVRTMVFVESALRSKQRRQRVDPAEFAKLLDEISTLEEQVRSTEVEPRLRMLILDHLTAIRRAVSAYEVGGIDYLEKVVAESVGAVLFHHRLFTGKSEPASKFARILQRCGHIVSGAKAGIALLGAAAEAKEAIDKLLE